MCLGVAKASNNRHNFFTVQLAVIRREGSRHYEKEADTRKMGKGKKNRVNNFLPHVAVSLVAIVPPNKSIAINLCRMCCRKLLVWFPRTYLDVEEVLDVEGDGRSVHGGIIVQTTVVRDVSPNGKRYRLCLKPHRGAMISRTCRGACDTDEERNT